MTFENGQLTFQSAAPAPAADARVTAATTGAATERAPAVDAADVIRRARRPRCGPRSTQRGSAPTHLAAAPSLRT
jgi:hypothetical protein